MKRRRKKRFFSGSFVQAEPVIPPRFSFVPDNWNYNASNPCLHRGGNYNQNLNHGLFYVNYNGTSNANANIGCRHLVNKGLATRSQLFSMHGRPGTPR